MPSNVAWFERLMYFSLAVGAAVFALDYSRIIAQLKAGFTEQFAQMPNSDVDMGPMIDTITSMIIYTQVFMFGLFVLLIWLAARRHQNWARWVIAILYLLGVPSYLYGLPSLFGTNPVLGAISVAQFALQIVALYLVFTGNARDWFGEAQHA